MSSTPVGSDDGLSVGEAEGVAIPSVGENEAALLVITMLPLLVWQCHQLQ